MEAYEQEGQRRDNVKDQIQVIGSYPHLHLIITGIFLNIEIGLNKSRQGTRKREIPEID